MKKSVLIITMILTCICSVAEAQENKIVIDGSTTVGPIAKAYKEYYSSRHTEVNITVSESGSGNGAKSLINGVCDIADMSRFMKGTEFQAAIENGVFPVAHVVALDGLAVIVHPGNPVSGLTVEQVKDVYTGKVRNWNQIGGPDQKIVKISRDTNSGTYETFESIVMGGDKISEDAEYVGSNGAARQRVQTTPGAMAYVGLGFVDDTVKAIEINGVYPEKSTISGGSYPIARPLFMFTDGYPKMGTVLYGFINLYLTPQGQEIIEEIGFVPVTNYQK